MTKFKYIEICEDGHEKIVYIDSDQKFYGMSGKAKDFQEQKITARSMTAQEMIDSCD